MVTPITVAVRKGTEGYVAGIKQAGNGYPYAGASPDEALGYAIREHWLGGEFNGPIKLKLDIASDTPATAMIPWLPKPGDKPPVGCMAELQGDAQGWTLWEDGSLPDWDGLIYEAHLDERAGPFKFQVPLPPAYNVVITDDVTRQDAQGIHDQLMTMTPPGVWNSVYVAYVTAIANRIDIYDTQRTQPTGEPA